MSQLINDNLNTNYITGMPIVEDEVVSAEELFVNDRVRIRKVVVSPKGKLYILTEDLSPERNGKVRRNVNRMD